jgi:hypothetical protein
MMSVARRICMASSAGVRRFKESAWSGFQPLEADEWPKRRISTGSGGIWRFAQVR